MSSKKNLLEIRNIQKRFDQFLALKGVSLDLYRGEIVSLLGVNGAGKTTLSSIVATLNPPTAGDILYNGVSIYQDIPSYRALIGYCAQKPNLHPLLTLEENLIFAGRYFGMSNQEINDRIEELSVHLSLSKYLKSKPTVLSGGYKQRFMIARSLMHSPRLIILDEPTVALDPHIRRQLWEYIQLIKKSDVTILLTTHYLDEAEFLSDRVCLLDQGSIKLVDTPQNLMTSFAKNNLEDVFLEFAHQTAE